ncbi:hypothetical protein M4D51_02830 [Microbacterium sp. p3-SID338]|uniref:hypothetical protein n=1 Tax=Microbacterium sp. p3-SID338 TaxID=2916214 RepID=UPI0021A7363D|nr:hypothetical protein [Microbacterium sp. p3-SID338]MCT1394654.1 hypothetical protein [Microbacterium sp. p3-SID338]
MALFTSLTLVAAVIAALIALRQLRAHVDTERARSRPYVLVDYAFKSILMQVEIKNLGATAASDIDLRVDPPFQSDIRGQADTLNAVFSERERISMLAPGRRILYTFDRAPDYDKKKRPEKYTVTVTYNDLPAQYRRPWRRGWARELVRYTDRYVLDFRQWSQASLETDYDNMNWNIAKRQERRTEKIVRALQEIAAQSIEEGDRTDTVVQSDVVSEAEFEHPVDVPPREPDPMGLDDDAEPATRRRRSTFKKAGKVR